MRIHSVTLGQAGEVVIAGSSGIVVIEPCGTLIAPRLVADELHDGAEGAVGRLSDGSVVAALAITGEVDGQWRSELWLVRRDCQGGWSEHLLKLEDELSPIVHVDLVSLPEPGWICVSLGTTEGSASFVVDVLESPPRCFALHRSLPNGAVPIEFVAADMSLVVVDQQYRVSWLGEEGLLGVLDGAELVDAVCPASGGRSVGFGGGSLGLGMACALMPRGFVAVVDTVRKSLSVAQAPGGLFVRSEIIHAAPTGHLAAYQQGELVLYEHVADALRVNKG